MVSLLCLGSIVHIVTVVFFLEQTNMPWPVAQLLVDVAVISLVPFRRRFPMATILGGIALLTFYELIHRARGSETSGNSEDFGNFITVGSTFALLLLVYSAFRWLPANKLWQVWLAAIPLLLHIYSYDYGANPVGPFINTLADWTVLFLIALTFRYRGHIQDLRVIEVRQTERQDLARELHDMVAHHVSAIAVQAQAAQAVADSNPEAVLRSLAAIEETASLTIREMRRMVGILRAEDDRTPMITSLTLLDVSTQPGVPEIRLRGSELLTAEVPAAVTAAITRIAQESITNARRHGSLRHPIDIVVSRDADTIHLTITNATDRISMNSDGFGLIGMHERAASLDGSLTAGPLSGRRWRVHAQIPLAAKQQVGSQDRHQGEMRVHAEPRKP